MSSTPQVSIIMPVYNAAHFLRPTVESILSQTFKDIEVICVNDGSTDTTPQILQKLTAQDARVRVLHQENMGAAPARNRGLAEARGTYVIFLDADDLYLPQMLERMVARAEKYHADVVICRAEIKLENGCVQALPVQLRTEHLRRCGTDAFCPARELPQHLFQFCAGWPWDKLYRRDFLLSTGLQFQPLRHTNDAYFVYMSLVKAVVVSVEPTVLVHHCTHSGSISRNTGTDTHCLTTALLAIHRDIQPLGNEALEKSFCHWAMNMAVWHYRQLVGEAAEALQTELRINLEPQLQLLSKGADYFPRKRDWRRYEELCGNETKKQTIRGWSRLFRLLKTQSS